MVFMMSINKKSVDMPRDEEKEICVNCDNPKIKGYHELSQEKNVRTSTLFQKFNDETTFHGVRYAFGNKRTCRQRIIWTVLIVCCLSILLLDVTERIQYFISSPVTVNIVSKLNSSIVFPAVTICNQNAFRRTLALQNKHFRLISVLFEDQRYRRIKLSMKDFSMPFRELYTMNAHQKEDLILRCKWKGIPCSAENFTTVLTRYGQCYTFNGMGDDLKTIESPGVNNGLDIIINSEEYDYMIGPHIGGGIKVLLHRQDEFPLPGEYGHELPTGRHGFMDVKVGVEVQLPYPHGYCKDVDWKFLDKYIPSWETCMLACENDHLTRTCNCRDFYLPDTNSSIPSCSTKDWACMKKAKEEFQTKSSRMCKCHTPCYKKKYKPTMSYGSISDYSSNQLTSEEVSQITERYETSREAAFHFEEEFKSLLHNALQLDGKQLPAFYEMLEKFEFMDKNMIRCSSEVSMFDDVQLNYLISQLKGSHSVFRSYMWITQLIDRGPFGVSDDKVVEFFALLDNMLMEIEKTPKPQEKKAYFKMVLSTIQEKMDIASNLTYVKYYVNKLLGIYPNIWIKNLTEHMRDQREMILQNNLWRHFYKKDIKVKNDSLDTIISECYDLLKTYRKVVRTYRDKNVLNSAKLNETSQLLIMYAMKYAKDAEEFNTWYRDDLLGNLVHLSQVLEYLQSAYHNIASDLKKQCNSVVYVKNIRKTSEFLQESTSKLKDYLFKQKGTMQEVSKYFLMRDMNHFIEGMRTFATNTFSDLKTDKKSSDCLVELLMTYYTLLSWYHAPGKYFTKPTKNNYCFKNAGSIVRESQNFQFNVSHWYDVLSTVNNIVATADYFSKSQKIDKEFYRKNFLHLNILFHDMSYDVLTQQEAYDIFGLLGDVGGAMGLFIGASVLTVFEVVDFLTNIVNKIFAREKKNKVKTIHVQSNGPEVCEIDGVLDLNKF